MKNYSGLGCIEAMSACESARISDQLNKFEKLSGRPLHGETLAGQSTTLFTHTKH